APPAANQGKWVEQPRLPVPVGEMGVIECGGKIHIVAGYARHRVDGDFHQVFDPKTQSWSLKAPFPLPCNHVALAAIGSKIYSFGGFVEQNRCPHSSASSTTRPPTNGRRSPASCGRAAPRRRSCSTARSICSAAAT